MNGGTAFYILQRISQSEEGTFGQFFDPLGNQLCVTCEPPPEGDHPCIPAGTYLWIPHNSSDHPNTWEITDVPGRSEILIHNGNFDTDSLGCTLVGKAFGWIDTRQAVTESVATLDYLRTVLPPRAYITIKDAPTEIA